MLRQSIKKAREYLLIGECQKIRSFSGNTWVAFLDICGFKHMLKEGRAETALNKFYNTIFKVDDDYPYRSFFTNQMKPRIANNQDTPKVSRLVLSDCAVLYVDNKDAVPDSSRDLVILLSAISKINRRLIDFEDQPQLMTTCAVEFGEFKYVDKLEDEH